MGSVLNDRPFLGDGQGPSCFGRDGNLRMQVEVKTPGRFTMSLKQGDNIAYDISVSPFSAQTLMMPKVWTLLLAGKIMESGRGCDHGLAISSQKATTALWQWLDLRLLISPVIPIYQ